MLKDLIRIQLSTKELTYQPGGIPATFEIAMRSVTLETVDPTDPAAATAAAVAKAIAASQQQASQKPGAPAPPGQPGGAPKLTAPASSVPGTLSPIELPPQFDRR